MTTNFATDENIEEYRALLGKRLVQVRNALAMSQYDVAKNTGFSQNPIFRLENGFKGNSIILATVLLYYIRVHKLNPNWLFEEDNSKSEMFQSEYQSHLQQAVSQLMVEFHAAVSKKK